MIQFLHQLMLFRQYPGLYMQVKVKQLLRVLCLEFLLDVLLQGEEFGIVLLLVVCPSLHG